MDYILIVIAPIGGPIDHMKLKKGPLEPSEDASEEENISTFWAEKEAQTFLSNSQISLCSCGQVCSQLAAAGPGRSVQGIGGGRSIDRRQSRRRLFLIQPFWLANPSSLATPCTSSATKINRQRADLRVSEHLRRESRVAAESRSRRWCGRPVVAVGGGLQQLQMPPREDLNLPEHAPTTESATAGAGAESTSEGTEQEVRSCC